jgi:anti-sigma regulatory factor (Ser/Thr protein kinase)
MTGSHHLSLRRDITELGQVNRFIEDVVQRSGWSAALIFPLQLCLEETVANVIRHGVVHDTASEIRLSLGEREGRVVACVEDDGEEFDPTRFVPDPPPRALEDVPVGGMGIHLTRRFAERISYVRVGPCNRLVLEFGKGAQATPA